MHVLVFPQLRKPTVEKIRRERINSSIEKLKSLLGQEFLKQQPDSRQEKADILEMDAGFLRLQQRLPESLGLQLYCSSWRTLQMCAGGRQLPVSVSSADGVPQKTAEALPAHTARHREQHTSAASDQFTSRTEQQQRAKLWRSGDPGRSRSMRMWTTMINSVITEHVISDLPLSWENNWPVFLYLDLTVFLPLAN